jgi:hypothetical protein
VLSHVECQLFVEPIDERRPVLAQERHESYRPLLSVSAGEGQGTGARELPAQRFVAPFGSLDQLPVECLQIVLHAPERGLDRAL